MTAVAPPASTIPSELPPRADVVVIGAGIVGLATARAVQLARPGHVVVVLDKEQQWAAHQSGHNSGVVHAGIYYRPGSQKAELCRTGRAELLDWCERHGVAWQRCGKVVVATSAEELPALAELEERATRNGVEAERIEPGQLAEIEPHVAGIAALRVPETAVVDFTQVCTALVDRVRVHGGTVVVGGAVEAIDRRDGEIVVRTAKGEVVAGRVANCAGLQADLVTRLAGDEPPARIVAFRGEFHEVVPPANSLVRALVYPVPDPRFPFLGVHLTRGIDGTVHAGPNAVLALSREGYRWRDVDSADLAELAGRGSTWRLAARYWRDGVDEVARSVSRRRLARAIARLVPEIGPEDLQPATSGVRAQAIRPDGTLLDDFAFAGDHRIVHVVNAPSPAATASLAIGRVVAARLLRE
jgi:L-2-hydroxyglutarate oxidase